MPQARERTFFTKHEVEKELQAGDVKGLKVKRASLKAQQFKSNLYNKEEKEKREWIDKDTLAMTMWFSCVLLWLLLNFSS